MIFDGPNGAYQRRVREFLSAIRATNSALADIRPAEHTFIENLLAEKSTAFGPLFVKGSYPPVVTTAERTLRAELLRCIITVADLRDRIPLHGVRIEGAAIEGPLDLSSAQIRFPLVLLGCFIRDPIDLRDAKTAWLSFKGSHTGEITASRLFVHSSLVMNSEFVDGEPGPRTFWSKGTIRLHGATVMGVLDCRGAVFDVKPQELTAPAIIAADVRMESFPCLTSAPSSGGICTTTTDILDSRGALFDAKLREPADPVLVADDLRVDSSAYFTSVQTFGGLHLNGAKIKDNLEVARRCAGHKAATVFKVPGGTALSAERIQVGGHVFLGDRDGDKSGALTVCGSVNFSHATIDGNLYCGSTALCRDGQITFDARDARIKGSVHFENGFLTDGVVRLTGARIGACAYFSRARFTGSGRTGLTARSLIVDGTLAWTAIEGSPLLHLDLRYARVSQLQDDEQSWPESGNLLLDGLSYGTLTTKLDAARWRLGPFLLRLLFDLRTILPWRPPLPWPDPRFPRLRWLLRQMGYRPHAADIDYDAVGKALGDHSTPLGQHLRKHLLDEDVRRIKSNIGRTGHVSKIDEQKLLIGVTLMLADPACDAHTRTTLLSQLAPRARAVPKRFVGYFRPQPYEQFARFLLNEGDKADSVRVLMAKEDARRVYSRVPLPMSAGWSQWLSQGVFAFGWRIWRLVLKMTVGYGYKPQYAVYWATAVVLVGAVFFNAARVNGWMVPAKEYLYVNQAEKHTAERCLPQEYPEFSPGIYSLDVFLPIISLHQKEYWLPGKEQEAGAWKTICPTNPPTPRQKESSRATSAPAPPTWPELGGAPLHWWLRFEISIGWLLTTAFVASYLGFLNTSAPEVETKSE